MRSGSYSRSRMRNKASLSVRLWPNSVIGSPSEVMMCLTPIAAAARTALMICIVPKCQGALGSSRFAWAQYVVMVSPYFSNMRWMSNGLPSRLAAAANPYSTPTLPPSVLSVTSAYLKPQSLIRSSWCSNPENGSINAKQPTLIAIRQPPHDVCAGLTAESILPGEIEHRLQVLGLRFVEHDRGVHDQTGLALGVVDDPLAVCLHVVRRTTQKHDIRHVTHQADLTTQHIPGSLEVGIGEVVDDLPARDVSDVFEPAFEVSFPVDYRGDTLVNQGAQAFAQVRPVEFLELRIGHELARRFVDPDPGAVSYTHL